MTRRVGVSLFVLLITRSIFTAQGTGTLSGIVVDAAKSPLPGVRVTVTTASLDRAAVTRADGRYTFEGLPVGRCTVKAELAGFETATKDVSIEAERSTDVSLMLLTGCLSEVDYVDSGFVPTLRNAATTIVHLRIVAAQAHEHCPMRLYCACTDYVAVVEEVLKAGQAQIGKSRINLLHEGTYRPGPPPHSPFSPGDEYVAFLTWDAGMMRFLGVTGTTYMFRVRDNRVDFRRGDAPGISDRMPIEEFGAALRTLLSVQR